jgi:16S rRNA (cytosine1402-N4)-methyltransferase
MLERCLALLAPALTGPGAVVVDATLGLGGHSEALLRNHPQVRLVGLDRDRDALAASAARLEPFAGRTTLVHAVYDELPRVLAELGLPEVQGVLFDLGVSSLQLDLAERGFAYAQDAPLDMRMDQSGGRTAADVVNTYPAADLARVLRAYGDERFARRIADAVCGSARRSRSTRPRAWRSWCAAASRRPPGAPEGTRRSGRSRPCASR